MLIICDTSSLSALAEAGLMGVLPQSFQRVIITESIRQECAHAGAPASPRDWISQPPVWLTVMVDPVLLLQETAVLGPGEASAITLAWNHRPASILILDEKRGRSVATALGLAITGTTAVIADAAQAGLIVFDDAVQKLQTTGFRLSPAVIQAARVRYEEHP